jgi:hypothetical protein
VLVDDGDRQWDAAPTDVKIGAVRLSGWQVHPLKSPSSFTGQDSFLIKLNYELALEPEVNPPPWFEVGFSFSDPRMKESVVVVDALPSAVYESRGPEAYEVGCYLSFTPRPGASPTGVGLPALSPFIDVFGVGGPGVRWRYMAPGIGGGIRGVRPGSYVSWIIAVIPAGCAELGVQLAVRYDVDPDAALGCLPGTHPAEFRLPLSRPAGGRPESRPAAVAAEAQARGTGRAATDAPPARIFISYAHDDDHHVDSVRAFAEFLARCGLDVHLDRWDLDQRRDWYQWAGRQVRAADYVLVVASPMCRRVGDGEIENTLHRGLQSELALLSELLHTDRSGWIRKLLPVVLPGGSVSDIPLFLQPQTADHYLVEDLTVAGAEDLIRVITGQPPFRRPAADPALLPLRLRSL